MKFTLYTATCRENAKNIKYPKDVEVIDEESLKSAVQFDHVSAKFTDDKRSNAINNIWNYIISNINIRIYCNGRCSWCWRAW